MYKGDSKSSLGTIIEKMDNLKLNAKASESAFDLEGEIKTSNKNKSISKQKTESNST